MGVCAEMGGRVSRSLGVLATAVVLAGCSAAGGSSSSPVASAPSGAPAAPAYRLRATTTQALPPVNQFGLLPMVTITGDNEVVVAGPQIMIYPGPLLPNLRARPITDAGFEKIVQRGRDLGMFTGSGNFTPPDVAPGAPLGRIQIVVGGVLHALTGDPSRTIVCITAPCNPAPGTPEAFGSFWASLADLGWLAGELGQEAPYVAAAYAVLAGVEPAEQPSLHEPVAVWPLEDRLATFGKPIGSASLPRCGTARSEDATTLRPVLEMANKLTPWVDKGAESPSNGTPIQVRPMVPGEDVCLEVFGLSE
jgi:hypothetical protein